MMRQALQAVRHMSAQHQNKLIGPSLKLWMYNSAGFNKYGLMRDDCLHENEIVKEAIRRLPPDLYDERVFRIVRAGYLSLRNEILPKEQWVKYEDDVPYLQPYIEEIKKEIAEKEAWDNEP